MIDIHSHIIFDVDDGSKSIDDSILMIKEQIQAGVTDIIATPHHMFKTYVSSKEQIKENFDILVAKCKELNLNVNLYLGCEIYYTSRENIIQLLQEDKLLTMNNKKIVLLEFSTSHGVDDIEDIIYNFDIKGYKVIIAHIERYYKWFNYDEVANLKSLGALIQINSGAVVGNDGRKMKKITKRLLKDNLVDFIASDIHHFRKTTMAKAYKKVKNKELFNNNLIIS